MIDPPSDFAYLLEPDPGPKTMTVGEFREGVKKVATITASSGCVSYSADPATLRRMRGSRKFYEICRREGVGWYLPARVVSRLPAFPKGAVCSVVPITFKDVFHTRIEIGEDPERELYALRIQWTCGEYFFVLIREDSWV
jgi:hypothetical protein